MYSIINIKITTIHVCKRHFSLNLLLHSSNFPKVARIEMKHGMYAYYNYHFHDDYMFPWRPHIVRKSLRQISSKLLLHSSNLLTVARMEVKLGAHVYYIVFKTTTTTNSLRHFSLKLPTSFLKLANRSTHGGETCVLHRFHDNHNNKSLTNFFFIITSSLLKLVNGTTHGDELGMHAWNIISMTTTLFEQQHSLRQFS